VKQRFACLRKGQEVEPYKAIIAARKGKQFNSPSSIRLLLPPQFELERNGETFSSAHLNPPPPDPLQSTQHYKRLKLINPRFMSFRDF
jgi:hypothetical protein